MTKFKKALVFFWSLVAAGLILSSFWIVATQGFVQMFFNCFIAAHVLSNSVRNSIKKWS